MRSNWLSALAGRFCLPTVLVLLVLLISGVPGANDSKELHLRSSMVSILANASRYDGQRVSVFGYLAPDWNLYLTREHATGFDLASAIYVSDTDAGDIAASGCLGKYVLVDGTVRAGDQPLLLWKVQRVHVPGVKGYDCYRAE